MVLFLSESDVEAHLRMPEAIDIVDRAFREFGEGSAMLLPRTAQMLPGSAGAFRTLSAVLPQWSVFGLKTLTGLPGKRLPGEVYFVILLFDMVSGALRAIVSANHLTGVRTGAASGVAAHYLAAPDASRLAVFGAGAQAWYQIEAICAKRQVETVAIVSPTRERAEQLADRVENDLGVHAEIALEPRAAVEGADLIVTATTSSKAVVRGEWLQPGAHVTAIGANARTKRELDVDCFRRGRLFTDSREQILQDAGDVLDALAAGMPEEQLEPVELSTVCAGKHPGRSSVEEITIFKSVGVALQDVSVAAHVVRAAEEAGTGTWLDPHALRREFAAQR